MAQHWDGSTWSTVTVPNPAFCTGHSYLSDVAATSATNVVATGDLHVVDAAVATRATSCRWNGTQVEGAPREQRGPDPRRADQRQHLRRRGVARRRQPRGRLRDDQDARRAGRRSRSTAAAAPSPPWSRSRAGWPGRSGTGPSPQPPFAGPGSLRLRPPRAACRSRLRSTSAGCTTWPTTRPAGSGRSASQLPGGNNVPLVVSRPASLTSEQPGPPGRWARHERASPDRRHLRADGHRQRHRAGRLLGVLVRPVPAVRAGLRGGVRAARRRRVRQRRHRGRAVARRRRRRSPRSPR